MLRVQHLLEDLVTAKVQGDLVQKRGLPAPLPLKACGNVLQCCIQWSNFDYLSDMELLNSVF